MSEGNSDATLQKLLLQEESLIEKEKFFLQENGTCWFNSSLNAILLCGHFDTRISQLKQKLEKRIGEGEGKIHEYMFMDYFMKTDWWENTVTPIYEKDQALYAFFKALNKLSKQDGPLTITNDVIHSFGLHHFEGYHSPIAAAKIYRALGLKMKRIHHRKFLTKINKSSESIVVLNIDNQDHDIPDVIMVDAFNYVTPDQDLPLHVSYKNNNYNLSHGVIMYVVSDVADSHAVGAFIHYNTKDSTTDGYLVDSAVGKTVKFNWYDKEAYKDKNIKTLQLLDSEKISDVRLTHYVYVKNNYVADLDYKVLSNVVFQPPTPLENIDVYTEHMVKKMKYSSRLFFDAFRLFFLTDNKNNSHLCTRILKGNVNDTHMWYLRNQVRFTNQVAVTGVYGVYANAEAALFCCKGGLLNIDSEYNFVIYIRRLEHGSLSTDLFLCTSTKECHGCASYIATMNVKTPMNPMNDMIRVVEEHASQILHLLKFEQNDPLTTEVSFNPLIAIIDNIKKGNNTDEQLQTAKNIVIMLENIINIQIPVYVIKIILLAKQQNMDTPLTSRLKAAVITKENDEFKYIEFSFENENVIQSSPENVTEDGTEQPLNIGLLTDQFNEDYAFEHLWKCKRMIKFGLTENEDPDNVEWYWDEDSSGNRVLIFEDGGHNNDESLKSLNLSLKSLNDYIKLFIDKYLTFFQNTVPYEPKLPTTHPKQKLYVLYVDSLGCQQQTDENEKSKINKWLSSTMKKHLNVQYLKENIETDISCNDSYIGQLLSIIKTTTAMKIKTYPSKRSNYITGLFGKVCEKLRDHIVVVLGYSYGGSVVSRIAELFTREFKYNGRANQIPDLYMGTFGSIYIPESSRTAAVNLIHHLFDNDVALYCNNMDRELLLQGRNPIRQSNNKVMDENINFTLNRKYDNIVFIEHHEQNKGKTPYSIGFVANVLKFRITEKVDTIVPEKKWDVHQSYTKVFDAYIYLTALKITAKENPNAAILMTQVGRQGGRSNMRAPRIRFKKANVGGAM